MKLPKDFGAQVAALAESTPREAIENLLKALLPKVPVATRKFGGGPEQDDGQWSDAPSPHVPTQAPNPFTRKRAFKGRASDMNLKVLTIVVRHNPYKTGTKAARTFQLFQECDRYTVAAIKKRACLAPDLYDMGYLHYSSRDGYITLT